MKQHQRNNAMKENTKPTNELRGAIENKTKHRQSPTTSIKQVNANKLIFNFFSFVRAYFLFCYDNRHHNAVEHFFVVFGGFSFSLPEHCLLVHVWHTFSWHGSRRIANIVRFSHFFRFFHAASIVIIIVAVVVVTSTKPSESASFYGWCSLPHPRPHLHRKILF